VVAVSSASLPDVPRVLVEPVACFSDNYAYVIALEGSTSAAVVDPSQSAPVEALLASRGWSLAAVLCTHHHPDHIDGLDALAASHPGLEVFAHVRDRDRIQGVTRTVEDGDTVEAAGISFRAIHVPGHTLGALAWYTGHDVFTGDTLFLAGCGRLFEGTARMLYASLRDRLAVLPPDTRVWCGHEYTESNLRFANHVEPGNSAVQVRRQAVRALRARGRPSVPATIAQELETNPFLRCHQPEVVEYARAAGAQTDAASVFALLRDHKNTFRG
jgi:hydroxyacylglutathione hydrolase